MVPIIIISIFTVIVFIIITVSLISLIIHLAQKTKVNAKKAAITLSSLFFLLIVLASLDIYLIASYVYTNRDKIIDKSAEVIGKGLALTAANIEKGWDKNLIKKFGNLEISIIKNKFKKESKGKIYRIELMLDNHSPVDDKVYFHDLIENNYLVVCDDKDIVYSFNRNKINYDTDKIPMGKTKASFEIIVPKDVNLEYIKFVTNKISLQTK